MEQRKSKSHMLKRLKAERERLAQTISILIPGDMVKPGVVRHWTTKDVLAHLADWEAHMLIWIAAARAGDPVEGLDPDLGWQQLDLFNQRIFERHRDQTLDEVLEYFHSTHEQFMDMVEAMPEQEMMTSARYPFLGTDSVYEWFGQYADHDAWGQAKIADWKSRNIQPRKP